MRKYEGQLNNSQDWADLLANIGGDQVLHGTKPDAYPCVVYLIVIDGVYREIYCVFS